MTVRDAEGAERPDAQAVLHGRKLVAVVGIDRYVAWPKLDNAVNDANGVLRVLRRLGFEPAVDPLLDEAATADAIRRLVTDDLAKQVAQNDSLVLLFAGHGHTRTSVLQSGPVMTGFLIPHDGESPGGHAASWLRLDALLSDIVLLAARHILVILDACHSGIALGRLIKWRGIADKPNGGAFDALRSQQSRRVIASALGDQPAMDGGPMAGHSLFTGVLIEALTGGLAGGERRELTGSELATHVQRCVTEYTNGQQTPDFGTLERDERGELVFELEPQPGADRGAHIAPGRSAVRAPWRPRARTLLAGVLGAGVLAAGIAVVTRIATRTAPVAGAGRTIDANVVEAPTVDAAIADVSFDAPPDAAPRAAVQLATVTGQQFGFLVTTTAPLTGTGDILRARGGWTLFADPASSRTRFYVIVEEPSHSPAKDNEVVDAIAVDPAGIRVDEGALDEIQRVTSNRTARHLLAALLHNQAATLAASSDCRRLATAADRLQRAKQLEPSPEIDHALAAVDSKNALHACPRR